MDGSSILQISLGVALFTVIIVLLVLIILAARSRLVSSGSVLVLVLARRTNFFEADLYSLHLGPRLPRYWGWLLIEITKANLARLGPALARELRPLTIDQLLEEQAVEVDHPLEIGVGAAALDGPPVIPPVILGRSLGDLGQPIGQAGGAIGLGMLAIVSVMRELRGSPA